MLLFFREIFLKKMESYVSNLSHFYLNLWTVKKLFLMLGLKISMTETSSSPLLTASWKCLHVWFCFKLIVVSVLLHHGSEMRLLRPSLSPLLLRPLTSPGDQPEPDIRPRGLARRVCPQPPDWGPEALGRPGESGTWNEDREKSMNHLPQLALRIVLRVILSLSHKIVDYVLGD